jgi:hypothetical protein
MSGPSIKGEWQDVKSGLQMLVLNGDGGEKTICLYNGAKDLQFNVTFEFLEPAVECLGDTEAQGNKFGAALYPFETKEFAKGKWKAYKRGFSFGAPDQAWMDKQAAASNSVVDDEIGAVKKALKESPKDDGKYTAEYIAAVCEAKGVPFIDLTFAPRPSSIARDWEPKTESNFAWKRPDVYCTDASKPACLFVGDIEPNDIDQGNLGNCYFLCALACLSEFPETIKAVFRCPQNHDLGIYRARMCKNGWWQIITMDDTLPTARDKPVYAKNREEPNELWVSIIEKAYAKLHGSYVAIKAGDPAMAMSDMIGGPYQKLKEHADWDDKAKMWQLLQQADDEDHLMSIGTPGSDTTDYGGGGKKASGDAASIADRYKAVGLVPGHAFSLIRVKEYQGHKLCMIRNPWGNGMEWNGDWSDDDKRWTADAKKALGFYAGDDGTFWMSWEDVVKWFDSFAVCYVLPTWTRLRVAANFAKGVPDLVVKLTVTKAVKFWAGAHQKDSRGLVAADPDRKYLALLLNLLQPKADTGKSTSLLASNKGSFVPSRDVYIDGVLEASDAPYYLLCQSYHDQEKSFVLSLFLESDEGVTVEFVAYKEGSEKKFNPPSNFPPATCTQKAAAKYQLVSKRTAGAFHELTGDSAKLGFAPPAAAPAAAAAAKKPAPKKAAAPPKAVGAAAPAAAAKKKKVTVTVIAGRDLVSRDLNGLSDPYVTMTVVGSNGKQLAGTDEVSTKYINNTLNPDWGEQFAFEMTLDDTINFHCWDKDLFGRDDMGSVAVKLANVTAPVHNGVFKLEGKNVSGEIQVLIVVA